MGISDMNPRKLAEGYGKAMGSPIAKILDWACVVAFAGYTAYLFATQWPSPTVWTWLCLPALALGVAMSSFDWKSKVESVLHRSMSRRRR